MADIITCPFCSKGDQFTVFRPIQPEAAQGSYVVYCPHCTAKGPTVKGMEGAKLEAKAVEAWNKRQLQNLKQYVFENIKFFHTRRGGVTYPDSFTDAVPGMNEQLDKLVLDGKVYKLVIIEMKKKRGK